MYKTPAYLKGRARLKQRARLLCLIGWKLAVSGAETRLIMQTLEKLCEKLHLEPPEIIVTRSVIWIEICQGCARECAQRKIRAFGINMSEVSEISLLCARFLRDGFGSFEEFEQAAEAVGSPRYDPRFLCVIEAFAALCFAFCNGGDLKVCLAALAGGFVLMAVRFCMSARGYFTAFVFIVAAFSGCSAAMLASRYVTGADEGEMRLAIMATTLLLVPGYPYMNGFLDVFKGYLETGVFRLMHSVVLTMAAAMGLLGALWFTGIIENV
jgi:uncharacterized membrane protein YjjP (DUF1212 family)